MSDLVKYLRAHMAPDRPCKRSEQDIACGQAADEIERLRRLLREAADDIEHWGGYASEYFKDKWHLDDDIKKYREAAGAAVQPSASLRCQSEASVILRSIRGDIEAAYNGLDYLTSIHVATAADPNGGRNLAGDAAEIKGRLLQHMKRIDAVVTPVTVNGDSADAGRCECNCRTDTLCAFCTDARLNGSAVQPERCCLDYPRCDCNSPPEPAQEPKGCNHFPGQVNCEWCTEVPHE